MDKRMIEPFFGFAFGALLFSTAACSGAESSRVEATDASSAVRAQEIEVAVMSGREQPPAKESKITKGAPVTIRLVGLGPPKGTVDGPNGSPLQLVTAPVEAGANTSATTFRFTPQTAGTYVVKGESGLVLAKLIAE